MLACFYRGTPCFGLFFTGVPLVLAIFAHSAPEPAQPDGPAGAREIRGSAENAETLCSIGFAEFGVCLRGYRGFIRPPC